MLTRQLIGEVYDVECEIYTNPITGGLGIAYLPGYPLGVEGKEN